VDNKGKVRVTDFGAHTRAGTNAGLVAPGSNDAQDGRSPTSAGVKNDPSLPFIPIIMLTVGALVAR
jgi:hypothetical protein